MIINRPLLFNPQVDDYASGEIDYKELDPGISNFVKMLHDSGVLTYTSCQGRRYEIGHRRFGRLHCFTMPTVGIASSRGEGEKEFINRVFDVVDGIDGVEIQKLYQSTGSRILYNFYLTISPKSLRKWNEEGS